MPPATVAAYQYEGDEPENKVSQMIDKFVLEHDLPKIKPDLRIMDSMRLIQLTKQMITVTKCGLQSLRIWKCRSL